MTTFQRGYINLFDFFSATEKKFVIFFLLQKKKKIAFIPYLYNQPFLRNQIKNILIN